MLNIIVIAIISVLLIAFILLCMKTGEFMARIADFSQEELNTYTSAMSGKLQLKDEDLGFLFAVLFISAGLALLLAQMGASSLAILCLLAFIGSVIPISERCLGHICQSCAEDRLKEFEPVVAV